MDKGKKNENIESEVKFADNLSDITPKEQTIEASEGENTDENKEATDNVAEELAQLKDAYIRLMAEYDNYRKRTIKEKSDLIKNGGEKTLTGLLPIIDDFDRAMKTMETATNIEAIREGIDLIYIKFIAYLQQNGVKPVETLGQPFDPDFHEAIATLPSTDEDMTGKVINTIQTGYMLNDKVIRHAKVVVAN
jgi:molecular chaperone GrpE